MRPVITANPERENRTCAVCGGVGAYLSPDNKIAFCLKHKDDADTASKKSGLRLVARAEGRYADKISLAANLHTRGQFHGSRVMPHDKFNVADIPLNNATANRLSARRAGNRSRLSQKKG